MRKFVAVTDAGIEVRVIVQPKSSKSEITGEFDGMLKVRLNSPPVDGAANKELIKLFSKFLGVAKSNISIIRGEAARTKVLRILSNDAPGILRLFEQIESV